MYASEYISLRQNMGRHPRTDEQSEDAFDPNKRLSGLIVIPAKCLGPVQGPRPGSRAPTGPRAHGPTGLGPGPGPRTDPWAYGPTDLPALGLRAHGPTVQAYGPTGPRATQGSMASIAKYSPDCVLIGATEPSPLSPVPSTSWQPSSSTQPKAPPM